MKNFSNNLRKLRKKSNLTQESLADLVGVSNSAISKWELGVSLPDTSILPSLAKALDTDLNSLFSFRERLNKTETTSLTNRVKKLLISKEYDKARELSRSLVLEYPKDEELLLNISSQLIIYSGYDDPSASDFKNRLNFPMQLLENLETSHNITIANQAKFVLSQAYSNLEKYEEARILLMDLAKSSLDTDIPLLSLLMKDSTNSQFLDTSSIMLWKSVNKVISILDMTSTFFKDDYKKSLDFTNLSIDMMNMFNSNINFAYYKKCKLLYNMKEYELSAECFKQFAINLTTFPLSFETTDLFTNIKISLDVEDLRKNRKQLVDIYLDEDLSKLDTYKDYKDAVTLLKNY